MRLVTSSPTNQWRTTKPRPARQSGSLSGRPQTSRRRLAMTRQAWAKYQCQSRRADFQGDGGRGSCSVKKRALDSKQMVSILECKGGAANLQSHEIFESTFYRGWDGNTAASFRSTHLSHHDWLIRWHQWRADPGRTGGGDERQFLWGGLYGRRKRSGHRL